MTTWSERVAKRRTELGLTNAELARLCGVRPASAHDWESGKTKSLKGQSLIALATALKTTPEWITTGRGGHTAGRYDADLIEGEPGSGAFSDGHLQVRERSPAFSVRSNVLTIAQLDVKGSMGRGIDQQEHVEVVRMMQVNLPDLRRILPSFTAPANLVIITGLGDSMRPTFHDGDPIIVDSGVKEVTVDGVYVLQREHELFIKRVQRQLDGTLMMISDNPRYPPQHIRDDMRQQFSVIGRALGVWNFEKL